MSEIDSAALGKRLRELRLSKDIRQAELAKRLEISAAYLNLLEKGKRSMQFPLLIRGLELLGVGLDEFMASIDDARPDDVLAHLISDPLARTLELEAADLAQLRAEPKAATTIAALFNLYKNTRAQLQTATHKLAEGSPLPHGYAPGDEVTDFLQEHGNYFPELEELAAVLRTDANLPRRFGSEQLASEIARRFELEVSIGEAREGTSVVRELDRQACTLWLSSSLSEHALKFQLAHSAGLLLIDESNALAELLDSVAARHPETRRLIKIHLANYLAGAVILPYRPFFDEVRATRYDVDRIARSFETSFEMVAHRMCNLGNPEHKGVPLHFLRVDVAGNVSKRYSASGMQISTNGGSCPKKAVHAAFLSPATLTKQFSIMPDGTVYFCFARVVSEPLGGSLVRGTTYSIGLGCTADHADEFVYADNLPRKSLAKKATPVGLECRFCERANCNQRAAPSYKYAFSASEDTKKDNFFSPIVGSEKS
ncbi:MAG: DUF2083 domain-containing protein [Deltaproteobacteria bacterium]|nr:DUF2083 domain-containing protein [Deltaproteobacteria bacterium]